MKNIVIVNVYCATCIYVCMKGHFSKFLPPGSVRVKSEVASDGVEDVNGADCSWPYGQCDGDHLHTTGTVVCVRSIVHCILYSPTVVS